MSCKYLFIGLIFQILSYGLIQAQSRFHLGPKLGYQLSTSSLENVSAIGGAAYGAGGELNFNGKYSASIDALISNEGYEVSLAVANHRYLQLPIYITSYLGYSSVVVPKIHFGVAPSILLQATVNDVDYKDTLNKTGVSAIGGIGLAMVASESLSLHIDARVYYGLTAINPDQIKNRVAQLLVGLAYGF